MTGPAARVVRVTPIGPAGEDGPLGDAAGLIRWRSSCDASARIETLSVVNQQYSAACSADYPLWTANVTLSKGLLPGSWTTTGSTALGFWRGLGLRKPLSQR
ncbi:hypothetical protein [Amycolatopsis sp. cmx-4-54]|uniref:hypothetical protein n=1 Tax=Amycolatopsis sp. cmx-4-54 TaxID=2790936 RepID=UPI00397D7620